MEWDKNDPRAGLRTPTTRCACIACAGKNSRKLRAFNAAANPVAVQLACGRDEQDLSCPPAEMSNAHRRRMDDR